MSDLFDEVESQLRRDRLRKQPLTVILAALVLIGAAVGLCFMLPVALNPEAQAEREAKYDAAYYKALQKELDR